MVSEATSIANGCSQVDEAPRGSLAARGINRPLRGRGRRPTNRNVRGNASNVGNPARSGPSQGGNAGNVGDNGDAIDRINQLAAAVTQMATMLTQINGMPIPLEVQQLGGEIPRLEASHQNRSGNGRGRALQPVIMLETLIMALKEAAMRMKGHTMWPTTPKTCPTMKTANVTTCETILIVVSVVKICRIRLMSIVMDTHMI